MAQQQFIGGQSEEMYDTYVNEMSPIEGDEAFAVVTTEVGLEETLAE